MLVFSLIFKIVFHVLDTSVSLCEHLDNTSTNNRQL